MKKPVILFHGECWDGFGGGYSAWKKFGNKAEYYPLKHGGDLPKGLKGRQIYLIDFSFKEPVMKKLVEDNHVIALDHHISAEKTTKMADEWVYALKQSGAVIAWEYFHPGKKVPKLLQHIQDVDIWTWKLKNTAELMAYMGLAEYDFKLWDKIAKDWENPEKLKSYFEHGKYLLKYEDRMVERLLESAEVARFEGYKTLVVNTPVLHSEIGNRLAKMLPPISIGWSEKNGINRVSLRSNGKVDVSKLAAKYGGGGHKAAAGFAFPINRPKPWKIIKDSF